MEEKNELNDIILNRNSATNSNKKIVLAVATLGVILIIVVMLMNSVASNNTDNLPQAVLPPKPELQSILPAKPTQEEPLFEDVKVMKDENQDNNNLDDIAKKLKQESQGTQEKLPAAKESAPKQEQVVKENRVVKDTAKTVTPIKEKAPVEKVATEKVSTDKAIVTGAYYIQVGSFSKYEPNKKFLISITDKGYSYTYHNVSKNANEPLNKVLVGPFKSEKEARDALAVIRNSIEAGAFLTRM
ncbi:MAG: SPOR domain-containing protein [Campylobacterales bacterium]|nr:SPOR domain-containing protein [Campylobacterales bacterium]